MADLNIKINPEQLEEKGTKIIEEARAIQVALNDIKTAKNVLNSWQSVNKDKYDSKINAALPKMSEMVDVIASYGGVAKATTNKIRETENSISKYIDENLDSINM